MMEAKTAVVYCVMNMLNEIVVYECYIFRMAECREQGIMPLK